MKVEKRYAHYLISGLLGAVSVLAFLAIANRQRPAAIYITPASQNDVAPASAAPSPSPDPPRIFVSGAVVKPGVYQLPHGSIIQDAIQAAGGFDEKAERDVVNLALDVTDGMHVHVPAVDEQISAPLVTGRSESLDGVPDSLVNINTASTVELESLPGIGPALAQRIVDYRDTNGSFVVIDDIMEVSGIGPSTFENIKDLITIN